MSYFLQCIECQTIYDSDIVRYQCDCNGLLEVKLKNFSTLKKSVTHRTFDERLCSKELTNVSGVWRFRELVLPIEEKYIVSKPEGNTNLYEAGRSVKNGQRKIGEYVGVDTLYLKHEGENPTGSFKDRGMTTGISQAKKLKASAVACASTGNTSASLASYAAMAGMDCYIFIPEGKISYGKLAQSIAYAAVTIQIKGNFDMAMELVQRACNRLNIYLLNSINPYRIEGQKSIGFELLQQCEWNVPDWIVLPAGNLGNTSAIGKGLLELKELGIIKKLPRIASVQAHGANPFYQSFKTGFSKQYSFAPETVATAIRIGNPVSYSKAKRIIQELNGIVEEANDQQILNAKAVVDASGIGCEPASASSIAGLKKLVEQGVIKKSDVVACILTGNILKDTDTILKYHNDELKDIKPLIGNTIYQIEPDVTEVEKIFKTRQKQLKK